MTIARFSFRAPLFAVAATLLGTLWAPGASAQENGDTAPGAAQPIAGVEIDAQGVLRLQQLDPRVNAQRIAAARQQLTPDLRRESPLRKVSLRHLEEALAERQAAGEAPSDTMRALAGLTRLEWVFFYPESGDIVIAGPAEGFFEDVGGAYRGMSSGRPTLLLEDLVVALRAFPPEDKGVGVISVSIDPTEEGLQRMQQYMRSVRNQVRPSDAARYAMGLKQNLGLQTVTFRGVSPATHFARVLVEADYRMKLIGIGLERLPIRMASFIDRASPTSGSANAMERWYFEPNYECVRMAEDGLGMQLVGGGVKLVGQNERVGADGQRHAGGRGNKASQQFCADFTERYDEIAAAVPVYAQLRNLMDLAIAAAFIRQQDFYSQAGWEMPVFGDESQLAVETHGSPQQVETAVNAIWKGNTLMTPLGGGVHVQPRLALRSDRRQVDSSGETHQTRLDQQPATLDAGQWWWD
jgi:hypothetical protein